MEEMECWPKKHQPRCQIFRQMSKREICGQPQTWSLNPEALLGAGAKGSGGFAPLRLHCLRLRTANKN